MVDVPCSGLRALASRRNRDTPDSPSAGAMKRILFLSCLLLLLSELVSAGKQNNGNNGNGRGRRQQQQQHRNGNCRHGDCGKALDADDYSNLGLKEMQFYNKPQSSSSGGGSSSSERRNRPSRIRTTWGHGHEQRQEEHEGHEVDVDDHEAHEEVGETEGPRHKDQARLEEINNKVTDQGHRSGSVPPDEIVVVEHEIEPEVYHPPKKTTPATEMPPKMQSRPEPINEQPEQVEDEIIVIDDLPLEEPTLTPIDRDDNVRPKKKGQKPKPPKIQPPQEITNAESFHSLDDIKTNIMKMNVFAMKERDGSGKNKNNNKKKNKPKSTPRPSYQPPMNQGGGGGGSNDGFSYYDAIQSLMQTEDTTTDSPSYGGGGGGTKGNSKRKQSSGGGGGSDKDPDSGTKISQLVQWYYNNIPGDLQTASEASIANSTQSPYGKKKPTTTTTMATLYYGEYTEETTTASPYGPMSTPDPYMTMSTADPYTPPSTPNPYMPPMTPMPPYMAMSSSKPTPSPYMPPETSPPSYYYDEYQPPATTTTTSKPSSQYLPPVMTPPASASSSADPYNDASPSGFPMLFGGTDDIKPWDMQSYGGDSSSTETPSYEPPPPPSPSYGPPPTPAPAPSYSPPAPAPSPSYPSPPKPSPPPSFYGPPTTTPPAAMTCPSSCMCVCASMAPMKEESDDDGYSFRRRQSSSSSHTPTSKPTVQRVNMDLSMYPCSRTAAYQLNLAMKMCRESMRRSDAPKDA